MDLSMKTLENYILEFLSTQQPQAINYDTISPIYHPLGKKIEELVRYTKVISDTLDTQYQVQSNHLDEAFQQLQTSIKQLKNDEIKQTLGLPLTKVESEIKKIQMYCTHLQKQNEITASYRHDIRNHMFCISALLNENKVSDAITYLNDLNHSNHKVFNFHTGNLILDILLSEKLRLAKEHDITTNTMIHIPADIPLHPSDWTILFANILDNAIEACSQIPKSEDRKLNVTIRFKEGYLCAKISNTFYIAPKMENEQFISQKEDFENHGLGIKNVKRVVEKYNGVMNITFDDTTFRVTFMIDTKVDKEN